MRFNLYELGSTSKKNKGLIYDPVQYHNFLQRKLSDVRTFGFAYMEKVRVIVWDDIEQACPVHLHIIKPATREKVYGS